MTSNANILLDDMVCVPTTKEGAEEIATAWSDVEQRALQRGGEVEAWVEDVANGCEKRVHVPDE